VLVLSLVVAVLAVARITRLLTEDRLALGYRRWIVNRYGEDSLPAYLAHCPWCTSIYVGLPIMPLAALWPHRILIAILAVPAASMLTGLLLERQK
jgi:hypothetical protein